MDRKLETLRRQHKNAIQNARDEVKHIEVIESHLSDVCDEYWRVNQIAGQAGVVLDSIDRDFKAKTKLNKTDIVLLFLCTALQCARQYLLPNDAFRLSDHKQGDKLMKNTIGKATQIVKPEWNDILFQSVPYDATRNGIHVSDAGLGGTTHRYRTLGHDPVLGWIFGTANIMTNSLTKSDFETFQVKDMTIIRHYPLGVAGMLDRAANYAQEDPKLLGASVARQAIHFGSDMFTKQGLPVPLIATVNNDLAKNMLTKWHIDTFSIMRGAGLSALINSLIFFIHRLFYQEDRDGSESMYEVRTRKILSYSNLLASSSNILVTAFTKDMTKLDVGGMIVTLYRLISDYKFINEIKRDFLKNRFYEEVEGKPYDFIWGI